MPGDGIAVLARPPEHADKFATNVTEARYLGEITLATLALETPRGEQLRLTMSGPQRLRLFD